MANLDQVHPKPNYVISGINLRESVLNGILNRDNLGETENRVFDCRKVT